MLTEEEIEKMTLEERYQLFDLLCVSLFKKPQEAESPEWHHKLVEERMRLYREGKMATISLEELDEHLGDIFE